MRINPPGEEREEGEGKKPRVVGEPGGLEEDTRKKNNKKRWSKTVVIWKKEWLEKWVFLGKPKKQGCEELQVLLYAFSIKEKNTKVYKGCNKSG